MPAKAGIQNYLKTLDSRLRGNDFKRRFETFFGTIIIGFWNFDIACNLCIVIWNFKATFGQVNRLNLYYLE